MQGDCSTLLYSTLSGTKGYKRASDPIDRECDEIAIHSKVADWHIVENLPLQPSVLERVSHICVCVHGVLAAHSWSMRPAPAS